LESDVLLAAPIELARLAGVPAPNLELVYALIDLLTRQRSNSGLSRTVPCFAPRPNCLG